MAGMMGLRGPAAAYQNPVESDRERGLWNTEFRQQRTPAASRPLAPRSPLMLGVTAWRLREARATDHARALIHETAGWSQFYIPERLGAAESLSDGDKVRISIEPGSSGFLYVISREVYAEGTYGDPYLIFPTGRIRNGRNDIHPGELVEIPEWSNPMPVLTLRRSKPSETGEQVFVLLTTHPLTELHVSGEAQLVRPALLDEWIRKWGGNVRMLDAPATKGAPLSAAESIAAERSSKLTPADPAPQLLYRTSAESQEALLAMYTLKLRP
jgi:hypothetical protein